MATNPLATSPHACQVAVVTPPGRGAVAGIMVSGSHARQIVGRLFVSAARRPLEEFPSNRIIVGRWQSAGNLAEGTPGEELVVSCRDEAHVEVHCHGGAAAVHSIVQSLVVEGCQCVPAAEWLRQCEPDWIVADARLALAQARTARVAAILLDQYRGAFSQAAGQALQQLAAGLPDAAIRQLQELLDWSLFGERLIRPWKIVLAGRTNVGKSSLINALLGYQRALVCHEAGTTRDILTDMTAMAGWPVELTDTAGLRTAETAIEFEGIRRAGQHAAAADLLLIVTDASQPWPDEDHPWASQIRPGTLLVHNKIDLVTATLADRPPGILTSALSGAGIAELIEAIAHCLVPRVPPPGTPLPFLPRHTAALTQAIDAIGAGDCSLAQCMLRQLLGPCSHS